MRLDAEGEITQHLRPEPVTQAYILESDHTPSGSASAAIRLYQVIGASIRRLWRLLQE